MRQNRKKGKEISTITALTAPTIYSSPEQIFSIVKRRSPQLSSSGVVHPTPNRPPYCILSDFRACVRVYCIRNAASPTGPVRPRSFATSRSTRPRGSRTPQGDHKKQPTRGFPCDTTARCSCQSVQGLPTACSPSASRTDTQQLKGEAFVAIQPDLRDAAVIYLYQ